MKYLKFICIFIIFLWVPTSYAQVVESSSTTFNIDSLLLKSIGGLAARQQLQTMTSLYIRGRVNMNDLKGNFEEIYAAPDKFYLKVAFDNFSFVQAYDGQAAWQQDQNGKTAELSGFEKKELLKNLYFESYAYLFPEQLAGTVNYNGDTTIQGVKYHEIHFHPVKNDTVRVFFNTHTGLKDMTVSYVDNMKSFVYIDSVATVSGVIFPVVTRNIAEGVPLTTKFTADDIELNKDIDLNIFSLPVVQTADFHFPPGKDKVVIPIEYRYGHIRVPVTVNGHKKAWFILDSGASANIFHKFFIENLQLPVVGTLPAKGIGGYEEAQLVKSDSLAIGDLILYDQIAGALDLSNLDRPDGGKTDFGGLLGYDFLSRFPVMIDYKNSSLTVYNPNNFTPPDSGIDIPFFLTMQIPTVRAELNAIPGDFIVDLGNAYGLIIHQKFNEANNLEEELDDIRDNSGFFGGVGGSLPGKTAYAASFKIGDVLIQSLRVIIPDEAIGMSGSSALAGNIGNLVLENFKILFDYNKSRLILYNSDN